MSSWLPNISSIADLGGKLTSFTADIIAAATAEDDEDIDTIHAKKQQKQLQVQQQQQPQIIEQELHQINPGPSPSAHTVNPFLQQSSHLPPPSPPQPASVTPSLATPVSSSLPRSTITFPSTSPFSAAAATVAGLSSFVPSSTLTSSKSEAPTQPSFHFDPSFEDVPIHAGPPEPTTAAVSLTPKDFPASESGDDTSTILTSLDVNLSLPAATVSASAVDDHLEPRETSAQQIADSLNIVASGEPKSLVAPERPSAGDAERINEALRLAHLRIQHLESELEQRKLDIQDMDRRSQRVSKAADDERQRNESLARENEALRQQLDSFHRQQFKTQTDADMIIKRYCYDIISHAQTVVPMKDQPPKMTSEQLHETPTQDVLERARWSYEAIFEMFMRAKDNLRLLQQHLIDENDKHNQELMVLEDQLRTQSNAQESVQKERDVLKEKIQKMEVECFEDFLQTVNGIPVVSRRRRETEEEKTVKKRFQEASAQVRIQTEEIERLSGAIQNLQLALEMLQQEKEAEMTKIVGGLKSELVTVVEQLEQAQTRATAAEAELNRLKATESSSEDLLARIKTHEIREEKMQQDIVKLQEHLGESFRRMNNMKEKTDSDVDRKLVANLLISYVCAPKEGHARRLEILNLISKVLDFSDDEKAKVGLSAEARSGWLGLFGANGSQQPRKVPSVFDDPAVLNGTFTDMWIAFLVKEAGLNGHPTDQASAAKKIPAPVHTLPDLRERSLSEIMATSVSAPSPPSSST